MLRPNGEVWASNLRIIHPSGECDTSRPKTNRFAPLSKVNECARKRKKDFEMKYALAKNAKVQKTS